LFRQARAGMGDAGDVDHSVHVLQQLPPFDRAGQVRDRDDLDRAGKHVRRLPHRGAHRMAGTSKLHCQRAADETRGASNEDASHDRPRENIQSSAPTSTKPIASAKPPTIGPGQTTVTTASTTSTTLTTNTRPTIWRTLKPLSV